MAIQFARVERVSRSRGRNACCKGAYNAREKVTDEKTNVTYNFLDRKDNVYHTILLPAHVDQRFKNLSELMNAIEHIERKDNSQLLKEYVLALPDENNISLDIRIEMVHEFIHRNNWIQEGLGVQVDIHKPHQDEKNWHAHLGITTRRFTQDGKKLGNKARDLDPQVRGGRSNTYVKSNNEINIGKLWAEVQNDIFKKHGLENRVDSIGVNVQEHIGPVRMRSILNQAADRNEERRITEIEYLNNGAAVLDKVTRHMSIFNKSDLIRAVKCVPDQESREKLVEAALADKSVISLFNQAGNKTQYFTTSEIREEEEKTLRLSSYVANGMNVFNIGDKASIKSTNRLTESVRNALSPEQHIALSELLTSNSALRILRGRAGVGKSHVLCQVAVIAKASNINVIGLAPTHKAKEALSSSGFEHTDTIKGMLFKLHNARFSLPKYSLLVVDEAGMIGNDDYQELLRVAATRKCNIILSGDERQLVSVQRGGMFEIFADKYGSSTILDIKRQSSSWGKSVAMAFSAKDVRSGISVLTQENRIKWQASSNESMEALLADWHKSNYKLDERLILAVKNKDVAALNHGVRQYLKAENKLNGLEIEVRGNHYMSGDRILIQKTNKELGIINGDLGEIVEVTRDRFIVSMQTNNTANAKVIEFNPSKYSDFKHGYATTIFKAQGASIKDVYVFHDGFAGLRNSYVALSRHIAELNLYVNTIATSGLDALTKQLSYDPELGSSLNHLTAKELENGAVDTRLANHRNVAVRAVNSAFDFIAKTATKITDKYLPKSEYYNYKEPKQKLESVGQVIDRIYEQNQNLGFESDDIAQKSRLVIGEGVSTHANTLSHAGNSMSSILADSIDSNSKTNTDKVSISDKDRFYTNADYTSNRVQRTADLQAKWDNETEVLRKETCFKAETIAIDLLGLPNKKLSNGRELRFGDNGKIAVRINGSKAGTWYDFSTNKGGDMFALVQDKQVCDFKSAADYLRQSLGMKSDDKDSHLRLVYDQRNSDLIEKFIKDKQAEERAQSQKQAEVNKLVQRSKEITKTSIAFRYLAHTRGISCNLGNNIKTTGIYVAELNRYLPSLIAYAKNEKGNITGGQQIILKANGTKADIAVPKKSFGKISGSFVDLGNFSYNNKDNVDNFLEASSEASDLPAKITIIAEGLETALSVKQALSCNPSYLASTSKIICSLGISNISNYHASSGEKIIIAADNDGEHSITNKTIDTAKMTLEGRGAYVEIVKPAKEGDFNDVLISSGEQDIQSAFSDAINKHTATSLNQYLVICNKTTDTIKLTSGEKENLAYIQKYNVLENGIVEAYRYSSIKGAIKLEQSRKSLEFAANYYSQNKDILLEAKKFGYKAGEVDSTKAMLGMDEVSANSFCAEIRDRYLSEYLNTHLRDFTNQKLANYSLEKMKPIMVSEQRFLKETYESLRLPINKYASDYSLYSKLQSGETAAKQPEILNKVFSLADSLVKDKIVSELDICREMVSYVDVIALNQKLEIASAIKKQFREPEKQAEARLKSTTPELALIEIQKEQNMLADLHGNINYFSHNKDLMSKVELAYSQRENKDFDKLATLAQKSLETGAETPATLLKKLQQTTDLKETHNKLDQVIEVHKINSQFAQLNNHINESITADNILKAIEHKENFLITLDKNIKYPRLHEKLLELGKASKVLHLEQVPKRLNELARQSIKLGTFAEKSIVNELKNTKNIEKTCQKLEIAIDAQHINSYLLKLDIQKQAANTPDNIMAIIKQEQEFLAGLHGELKHPNCHSDSLINSIKNAHDSIHIGNTGSFDKLSKFVTFLEKNTNDHDLVISTLKSTNNNITEIHQDLLESYHAKCIGIINNSIAVLEAGNTVTIDKRKFDCSMKFLDHLTKTRTHEYFPHKEVHEIQNKVQENHKQLQLSKGLDMEL